MRQHRIGLVVLSNPAWMGGVNYVLNWVKALNMLPPKEKPYMVLLYRDENGESIANAHRNLVSDIRVFQESRLLNLDMVYPVTQIFEAPFGSPWAAWIPDWQCKHMPEMFDETEFARRDLHYRLLATKAPLLIVSSQMAYNDTLRIISKHLVPIQKLRFPAVVDEKDLFFDFKEIDETLEKYKIRKKFFLVCNKFWKHKNPMVVFRALRILDDSSVCCVFTGDTTDERWPEYYKQIESYIKENNIEPNVRILGQIPRKDQLNLFKSAMAIIQPSYFEGWSTIVEEAKAFNKKILLSNFPVHVEQADHHAHLFDADNAIELADLILETLQEPSSHNGQQQLSDEHIQRHKDYIIDCARQFIRVAEKTRQFFVEKVHDPKTILIDLLSHLESSLAASIGDQIFRRTLAGTRLMFHNDPEQLYYFIKQISEVKPEFVETAKKDIYFPAIAKLSKKNKSYFDKIKNDKLLNSNIKNKLFGYIRAFLNF